MNNSPIFCSYAFLLDFIKSQPIKRWGEDDDESFEVENWESFKKFLRRNTLRMDKTPGEIAELLKNKSKSELDRSQLPRLLDRISQGKLRAKRKELFDFGSHNRSAIILSSDSSQKALQERGLLCLTPNETLVRDELYIDSGIAIEENQLLSWEEVVKSSLPRKCYNSLIIIDNYIARNVDENLGALLRQLLPLSFDGNEPFHLTIVCVGWMLVDNSRLVEIDLNHRRRIPLDTEHIKRELLSGYPYEIEVELLKINPFVMAPDRFGVLRYQPLNKPFHDRAIITNYNFVIAPGGLDLIDDDKAGKLTVVYGLYPDFARESFKTEYLNNNLFKIVKNQESPLNNPIIKQYMTSFDYLWRKAQDYRDSIKQEEPRDRMDENCLKEIAHKDYDENTGTLEVFDTNENYQKENRITLWGSNKILAASGCRSTEDGKLNQFLNSKVLLSEHIYYIDSDIEKLNTGACYQTDSLGRVTRMQVSLPFNYGMVRPSAGDNTKKVCSAKDGTCEDDGGHILARMLNGPNEAINILPMAKNVNLNFFGGLERIIKGKLEEHLLENDYNLFLDVIISYDEGTQSFRPSKFSYRVTEKPAEKVVIDLSFDNK